VDIPAEKGQEAMSWLFALLLTCSQAGFLRIVGEPTLALVPSGDGLKLFGEYEIQNQGDETARDVFPEFNIDQFTWSGEPQAIEAGGKVTWKVSQKILKSALELPLRGKFALAIYHHYADLNGYPFVIPSVQMINVGVVDEVVRPDVEMKIVSKGAGQYSANLKIRNPSAQKIKIWPQYLLPREMELRSPAVPLEVAAQAVLETSFLFQNQRGLPGSSYQAFSVLQWVENGRRQAVQATAYFKIGRQNKPQNGWSAESIFWGVLIWLLGAGLIAMWVFWIRPLRKYSSLEK
jgi:hypothetical protein